jgi:hypothetical protein
MTDWLYAYSDSHAQVETLRSQVDVLERVSMVYLKALEEISSFRDRNIDPDVSEMKGLAKAAMDSAKSIVDGRY